MKPVAWGVLGAARIATERVIPAMQATESESPRIRAALSMTVSKSGPQRRTAASARPSALALRQPPSPVGMPGSSSHCASVPANDSAASSASATTPPSDQSPRNRVAASWIRSRRSSPSSRQRLTIQQAATAPSSAFG